MERAPLPAEACPAIGQAYRRLGQIDKALDAFQRCYDADRKNAELAFFVGLGHEWLGKDEPAETFYKRALEIATDHQDSAVGLGRLRLHRNQYGEALTLAETVLAKAPSHVDALLVAGLAEQRAGHRQAARRHLEKAVALSHDYFDIHLALGILDYSESRVDAARRHFETAQKLDAGRRDELRPWLERTATAARTTS
jgi:tetratricopeptide (TPR) repeat protein